MTIEQLKLAKLGSEYWLEYVRLNGYARNPTLKGLKKLARSLDLNKSHVEKAIWLHLLGEWVNEENVTF